MNDAFAVDIVCHMKSGGILDKFQSDFYTQAQSFATRAMPTIKKVYWILFSLWAAWELAFDRLLAMNIDKLYIWWIVRICTAYIIEYFFLDPTLYVHIIKFYATLGSQMASFTVDANSSSPLGSFTPSAIMGINDCVASAIGSAASSISPLNILGSLELFSIQLGFLLITAIAAFYVMYIAIKIWITLFVGFVNTMFAGNSWTVNWWQTYLGNVIKYGMELMIVASLCGVIYEQLMAFVAQLNKANGDIISNFGVYIKTLAETGFMTFLLYTLPREIASALGGSFSGHVVNIGGKMMSRVADMAKSGGGMESGQSLAQNPFLVSSGGGSNPYDWSSTANTGGGNPSATEPVLSDDWQEGIDRLKAKNQFNPYQKKF